MKKLAEYKQLTAGEVREIIAHMRDDEPLWLKLYEGENLKFQAFPVRGVQPTGDGAFLWGVK